MKKIDYRATTWCTYLFIRFRVWKEDKRRRFWRRLNLAGHVERWFMIIMSSSSNRSTRLRSTWIALHERLPHRSAAYFWPNEREITLRWNWMRIFLFTWSSGELRLRWAMRKVLRKKYRTHFRLPHQHIDRHRIISEWGRCFFFRTSPINKDYAQSSATGRTCSTHCPFVGWSYQEDDSLSVAWVTEQVLVYYWSAFDCTVAFYGT